MNEESRRKTFAITFSLVFHAILVLSFLMFTPKGRELGQNIYNVFLPKGLPAQIEAGGKQGEPGAEETGGTLKDLTIAKKKPVLIAPSAIPKKVEEIPIVKPKPKKKTVITKPKPDDVKKKPEAKGIGEGTGTGTGTGEGFGPGFEFGITNSEGENVSIVSSIYSYYFRIIINKISNSWFKPNVQNAYEATLQFELYRDGSISTPKVIKSSGVRSLDMAAERAILNAQPFPPLPQSSQNEYLIINLTFVYDIEKEVCL
ncbi:MAG: TonB C-terminal domain-containing protein [Nanoarchaeota archaeon]|nr:TonB C-terminal domain-containing protein [Nanoarchaeota archaeon]MBU1320815.1 TonB C-terminal domain-containing protein [Nanoarchaeota archaeon]MBU1596825.1 TonB C-terminal domain-containing protein [Nanoarchaeota archaeon]MBU2440893.1 TonB C-terminal domain-containing protein [Nanoarchaeota archaeon]